MFDSVQGGKHTNTELSGMSVCQTYHLPPTMSASPSTSATPRYSSSRSLAFKPSQQSIICHINHLCNHSSCHPAPIQTSLLNTPTSCALLATCFFHQGFASARVPSIQPASSQPSTSLQSLFRTSEITSSFRTSSLRTPPPQSPSLRTTSQNPRPFSEPTPPSEPSLSSSRRTLRQR